LQESEKKKKKKNLRRKEKKRLKKTKKAQAVCVAHVANFKPIIAPFWPKEDDVQILAKIADVKILVKVIDAG
jgi:hypothetical protein